MTPNFLCYEFLSSAQTIARGNYLRNTTKTKFVFSFFPKDAKESEQTTCVCIDSLSFYPLRPKHLRFGAKAFDSGKEARHQGSIMFPGSQPFLKRGNRPATQCRLSGRPAAEGTCRRIPTAKPKGPANGSRWPPQGSLPPVIALVAERTLIVPK